MSEKGPKTGILNSIVFYNNPAVEFDFAAMFATFCGGVLPRSEMELITFITT
jgi:hypothetical protein